jgi:hypothetical protein
LKGIRALIGFPQDVKELAKFTPKSGTFTLKRIRA